METSKYFHNRVEKFLTYLPDRTLNAGIDAVTTIIVYDMAAPYSAKDYQNALAAWLQGRHDVWQDRIDEYKSNPTDENLADIVRHAINERTPHTQSDFDYLVEYSYRFAVNETLIENELKRRSNDNGER